jgi:hypothetical protein
MYNIKELLTNPILLDVVTKKIFDAVDEDGSGRISEDELHAILGSLAEDFGFERPTVAETEEILSLIDVDRSGLIDFTEFKRFFKKVLKAIRDDDNKKTHDLENENGKDEIEDLEEFN